MKINRIIAVAIVGIMIASGLVFLAPTHQGQSPQIAKALTTNMAHWGFQQGYAGNWLKWYVSNGFVNLSFNNGKFDFWDMSNPSIGHMNQTRLENDCNHSSANVVSDYYVSENLRYIGYPSTFTDSIGSGTQVQWMEWNSTSQRLNVSSYFRLYDSQKFMVFWEQIKNPLSYNVNWTYSMLSVNQNTLIGTTTADMEKWSAQLWTGSGTTTTDAGGSGLQSPTIFLTTTDAQASMTIGPLTQLNSGMLIQAYSDGSDTANGLHSTFINLIQVRGNNANNANNISIIAGHNVTSDKLFLGFKATTSLNPGLSDYQTALLASNTFESQSNPYTGAALWDSWNAYRRSINDSLIRSVADQLTASYPSIGWIDIDDGWELGAGTSTQKDTMAMQVDTAKFPNMASTVSYIHSKGLKAMLWVDVGSMWYSGSINTTHPDWRMKLKAGGDAYVDYGGGRKTWVADISNPAWLSYITTQFQSMRSTWGFDGFKIDFEVTAQPTYLNLNYNNSDVHVYMEFLNAVHNGTSTCSLVLRGGPINFNPGLFFGVAYNAIRSGYDVAYIGPSSFNELKQDIINCSAGYLIGTSGNEAGFPVPDIDMITEWTNSQGVSAAYLHAHVALSAAIGGLREFSFRLVMNTTYYNLVAPVLTTPYYGHRYIGGQTANLRIDKPSIFAQVKDQYTIDVAVINWGSDVVAPDITIDQLGVNTSMAANISAILDVYNGVNVAQSRLLSPLGVASHDGSLFEIQFPQPPTPPFSMDQMAAWMLAIGAIAGFSAIVIVAIGSRIRRG